MANKDIVTREVTYAGRACALKAYVAEPAGVEPSPAAIVVQEWWGLNDHIRDISPGGLRARVTSRSRRTCTRGRAIALRPSPMGPRN